MAKPKTDNTQIFFPVGSYAEVKAIGAPLKNISTCSQKVRGENMGCPRFEECDRAWKGEGRPKNEPYCIRKPDGSIRYAAGACFVNVRLAEQIEGNDGLFTLLPGDEYPEQGTERMHQKRDPDCIACRENTCFTHVEIPAGRMKKVVPYPELHQIKEMQNYVQAAELRKIVTKKQRVEKEQRLGGTLPAEFTDDVEGTDAPEVPAGHAERGSSKPRRG